VVADLAQPPVYLTYSTRQIWSGRWVLRAATVLYYAISGQLQVPSIFSQYAWSVKARRNMCTASRTSAVPMKRATWSSNLYFDLPFNGKPFDCSDSHLKRQMLQTPLQVTAHYHFLNLPISRITSLDAGLHTILCNNPHNTMTLRASSGLHRELYPLGHVSEIFKHRNLFAISPDPTRCCKGSGGPP
jgi:hypothetical protein